MKPGSTARAPRDEERDRGGRRATVESHRRDGHQVLAGGVQTLAGRREDRDRVGSGSDDVDRGRSRVDDVLAVVEDHQESTAGERVGQGLGDRHVGAGRDPECGGERVGNRIRVGDRRELDQPHTVGEFVGEARADREREPCLADTTHAGEGHQAVGPHELDDFGELERPADERGRRDGHVPAARVDRAQRGERDARAVGPDLEDVLDPGEVGQPVLTEIDELGVVEQRRGGRTHEDLTTVARGHDARRPVRHRTRIHAVAFGGLTRVDAHAHRERHRLGPLLRPETGLDLDRAVDRVARVGERDRAPRAGGGEHVPVARADCAAEDLVVACQRGRHRRRVVLPEARRTLDVGEEEGDDA